MPGKSRRRGQYSIQSKKRRGKLSRPAIAEQPAVAQNHKPIARPNTSVPSASAPTPMVKLSDIRYPYIATELRTIGIMAGLMLAVLVMLALVLP